MSKSILKKAIEEILDENQYSKLEDAEEWTRLQIEKEETQKKTI